MKCANTAVALACAAQKTTIDAKVKSMVTKEHVHGREGKR